MNVARLIGSVGGYFYSVGDKLLAVHMYGGNTANVTLGGKAIRVSQETDYPWSGDVALTIEADEPAEFELRLRVPDGRAKRRSRSTVRGRTLGRSAATLRCGAAGAPATRCACRCRCRWSASTRTRT